MCSLHVSLCVFLSTSSTWSRRAWTRPGRFINEPVKSTWHTNPTSTCTGRPSRRGTVRQNINTHPSLCSLFLNVNRHLRAPILDSHESLSSSPSGDLTEARRVLEALEKKLPGLAVVRIRRAALERRAGQLDQSEALLREAVAESKEKPTLHAFYSIKLARLLLKLGRDPSNARRVLQEALEISPVR